MSSAPMVWSAHMSSRSHAVLALSASVAVTLGLALVPSAATAHTGTAARKIPKIEVMKLRIDVAGYVEMRQLIDTTSVCSPGVTYTQTNEYQFETGKHVGVRLVRVRIPGANSVITSTFSRAAGSASSIGGITGYRTTNYCAPDEKAPEPLRPGCVKIRGKTSVGLTPKPPVEVDEGEEEELVPLDGQPMMLSVIRKGGARDPQSCSGVRNFEFNPEIFGTVVSTSWDPGISLSLPIEMGSIKLFSLKRKDRLQRTIVVLGPCDAVDVSVYHSWAKGVPPDGKLKADGDCWLRGKIVLTVRLSR